MISCWNKEWKIMRIFFLWMYVCMLLCHSVVSDSVTLWTAPHQASLSMEYSRQETRVGCHFLFQEIFLTHGLNLYLLHLLCWQVDSLLSEPLFQWGKDSLEKTVENSERDGNTRPHDLPLEKFVCRSGSNSYNWTWNNRLVPNRKRSSSRLYIVTLFI